MTDQIEERKRQIETALSSLDEADRRKLIVAANCGGHGGGCLDKGDALINAVGLELAFASTGRLRPDVWKMLAQKD